MNPTVKPLPWREIIIGGLLLLVIINVIFLDVRSATKMAETTGAPVIAPSLHNNPIIYPTGTQSQASCLNCQVQISEAIGMIQNLQKALTVTPAPTVINTPTPTPTVSVPLYQIASGSGYVKDYYVPLGTGSSTSNNWDNIGGLQATIDTSQYPPIKQVTLELIGYTPTGNQSVSVRLYNNTTYQAVGSSAVSWSGGGYIYLASPPISLTSGSNQYTLQMQTQLQYTSMVESARIHIVLY